MHTNAQAHTPLRKYRLNYLSEEFGFLRNLLGTSTKRRICCGGAYQMAPQVLKSSASSKSHIGAMYTQRLHQKKDFSCL